MSERLTPGDTAPAFTLPDADGNDVSLADHKGRKVIVYFYPRALTPGCTKQACDFTDNLDLLTAASATTSSASPPTSRRSSQSSATRKTSRSPWSATPPRRPWRPTAPSERRRTTAKR